ncbi:cytochrome bd-I oxidase subunit CydX [Moraxella nonliquefaciens]|jgi:cyd operon protein ybgT|nr:cytochrome bd-I oxidase subunit CydX [Moraxella nonliquefaciens]MCG7411788.1 cytochrome bd-I oxidase subunit CydX [Moraxella nonliquefaciens]
MWYFAWILGLGFAVLLAIISAVWVEFESSREEVFYGKDKKYDE